MNILGSAFPEKEDVIEVHGGAHYHTLKVGYLSIHFESVQQLGRIAEEIALYTLALQEEALSETHNAT